MTPKLYSTLSSQDASRYATNTIILETRSEVKVNSDPKIVLDTLSSQDASTHQILDFYLK